MYILLTSILVFVLCYISNFSFGLYYNTKILSQKISETKLKNTVLKLISFIVGLTCLSVASFLIPELLISLGIENTLELSDKTISILFGTTSLFYAGQALLKLKNIILKKEVKDGNIG